MRKPLHQRSGHLLDTHHSIVLMLDQAGRFIRWNRAAELLTGHSETEMVGRVLWESVLFQEDIAPVKRQLMRIMSGSHPVSLEYRWKIRGGAARWIACSDFEPRVSPDGTQCLAFTATDVTEFRHSRGWRSSFFEEFIRVREAERHEISRFIHDTVAQNLVALTFSLEQAQRHPAAHDAGLDLDLVDRCCRDIRLLGYMLAPAVLGDEGLAEAIECHARTLRESGALDIDFRAELAPDSLSRAACAALFAVVHEFTAKAITSRAGKRVSIVLKRHSRSVLMDIYGVPETPGHGSRDYPAIRERLGALGGHLEMTPDFVRVALPMALPAAA